MKKTILLCLITSLLNSIAVLWEWYLGFIEYGFSGDFQYDFKMVIGIIFSLSLSIFFIKLYLKQK
ncbi:MAG: hypothetical protein HOI06_00610 [Pelagibacteraceae bacterium]|jgi:hypothetical protein|nr:hypothetical protein [Flavobacteriaceae bacterium]MBT4950383.1 hypothetical protein [Pelagibacteraceae bacterium]MBT4063457.1 hypothetical protein [Flavobacteriaceae bacterium]MBT4415252.1 hypothetical protein [Flavobacteriaceae bacterium]MBT5596285.1 hypothetical protein [Flavobacteriaceae bacterium]|tara:strand:- start:429 stop:623 length:195 start_codon:yes stop_codon:yes gene_type:complete